MALPSALMAMLVCALAPAARPPPAGPRAARLVTRALVLRGGAPRRAPANTHGSWNVDGRWDKGGKKIKYMQSRDGFDFSRAKMRRQKRRWNAKYGSPGDSAPGAGADSAGMVYGDMGEEPVTMRDLGFFAPEGLVRASPSGVGSAARTRRVHARLYSVCGATRCKRATYTSSHTDTHTLT